MTPTEKPTRNREDDPRTLRSRRALIDAVIRLLDADAQQAISITRLVEAAGVTRPTFYQHFPDIPAALQQAALDRLDAEFPVPQAIDATKPMHQRVVDNVLGPLLHLEQNRLFYLRIVETAASVDFFERLVQFVKLRMASEGVPDALSSRSQADIADIAAGGSMWLVVRWLRGELAGTPKEIAGRIAAMTVLVHSGQTLPPEDVK